MRQNLKFDAIDSYGLEDNASASVRIEQRDFQFFANILGDNTIYLNDTKGKIQCNINVSGSTAGIDYFVTPQTSGSGKFYYNGSAYNSGEKIQVVNGVFEIEYEALNYNSGNHAITLVASDSTNQTENQALQFNIYKSPEVKEGTTPIIKFWRKKFSCSWGDCEYEWYYELNLEAELDNDATNIVEVEFEFLDPNPDEQHKGKTDITSNNGGILKDEIIHFDYHAKGYKVHEDEVKIKIRFRDDQGKWSNYYTLNQIAK